MACADHGLATGLIADGGCRLELSSWHEAEAPPHAQESGPATVKVDWSSPSSGIASHAKAPKPSVTVEVSNASRPLRAAPSMRTFDAVRTASCNPATPSPQAPLETGATPRIQVCESVSVPPPNSAAAPTLSVRSVLVSVEARYTVDPRRVYVFGHSNGAFMAHRLACDRAAHIAAILSLEGATWLDPTRCEPSQTVSVAEIHGDADTVIEYDGGLETSGVAYPGAPATVTDWATKNGCSGVLADTGQTLAVVSGSTTTVSAFGGCPSGIDVQLWTVHGGTHIPTLDQPGWGDVPSTSHAR